MKKEKLKAVLSWLPAVAVMVIIFYLSSQSSDDSAQVSMGVLGWINRIFNVRFNHDVIREVAHGCEYLGLGLMLSFALFVNFKKKMPVYSVAVAFVYSLSDEIHQIFVPGRSFQIIDILIDNAGAIAGTLLFSLIYLIIKKIKQRKN